MFKKIAINGLGRIGRMSFRSFYEYYLNQNNNPKLEIVAINGKGTIDSIYHMIKYDSVHGRFNFNLECLPESSNSNYLGKIIISNKDFKKSLLVFSDLNPENLPWGELGIDLVYECTGAFKDKNGISKHLNAGAKKVLVSSNCKGSDSTVVYGVNENSISNSNQIISNASCTTNCAALIARIVEESLGIISADFLTIHAYTSDQVLLDNNHLDLYRARAAGLNIIPTTSNVSDTLFKIYPHLEGKIFGRSIRVPVANVSYLVSTIRVKKSINKDNLKEIFSRYIDDFSKIYKNVIGYTYEFNVSTDFNHCPLSAVVDLNSMFCIEDDLIQISSWYDNEWAYSCRMHDVAERVFSV